MRLIFPKTRDPRNRLVVVVSSVIFSAVLALATAGSQAVAEPYRAPLADDVNCTNGIGSAWYISHACKPVNPHRGLASTFNNANLHLPDSYAFAGDVIKHVIHTASGAPCGTTWVEQGLMQGAEAGANHYFWYFARRLSSGNYAAANLGNESVAEGQTHRYELFFVGWTPQSLGIYDIRRDGISRLNITQMGNGSCVSSVGIASNILPDSLWWTGNFNATSTYWFDSPNGYLHSDFGYSQWIDYPCPPAPSCFNGWYYGIDWWSSNKP